MIPATRSRTDSAAPAAAGRVAYLFGADTHHGRAHAGGPALVNVGSTDIRLLRSEADDFVRIHIPANFGRLKARPKLSGIAVVLNLITDPDLNPRVLDWADRVLEPFAGRVLNRPAAVRRSSRDAIARLAAGIDGLVVPAVARFRGHPMQARAAVARAAIRFPAILRIAGTHNGEIVGLVADEAALLAALCPDQTYLLTEFVDSRGPDGLFHKIRIFFFGDAPVVRHCLVSDAWNVHGPDRERVMAHQPRWIERERRLLEGGVAVLPAAARDTLARLRQRIPLDFFGIDFALLPDGRLLLFEANATMNFFPLSTHPLFAHTGMPVVHRARAALDRLIAGKPAPEVDRPAPVLAMAR
jgi:glutathione synthase/RimK-type ligase-like ATP-grasp enzyme